MIVVYIFLAVSFVLLVVHLMQSRRRLPPGPWGWPVIGSALSVDTKEPHKSLANLAWRYGPVCGLRMGSVYTVLLSDPKLVRQYFAKDEFSGRAPLYLTHGIMKGYGLIAAEGERWRDQRRFVTSCLKNFGMVKYDCPRRDKMEKMICAAVDEAIEKLRAKMENEESELDPHDILHHCIGNLINYLVFGKVYKEDDELWKWLQKVQEDGVKCIGVSNQVNFLPILRFLPHFSNILKFLTDGQFKTHEIYRSILEDHRANPMEMNSFLAAFNEEMDRRRSNGEALDSFTDTQCFYLLADIYGAGVDTTLTTLCWFLLFMAAYPDEQDKIYKELHASKHLPTLADRPCVALEAAIMEVQRLRSIVPTGIPHGTTQDTKIEDYDIPKGSMIMPLQWAIHMNPSYWPDPHVFKPDRFIGEGFYLMKPDAFLPFQFGKRMCVGDELAWMILFLFSAQILFNFKILAPLGETIDLEGDAGITLVPKPQRLIFENRL